MYVRLPRNEVKNTSSLETVLVTNDNLTGRYDQVIIPLMTEGRRVEIKLDQKRNFWWQGTINSHLT